MTRDTKGFSNLEYHTLLALAAGPLHGYGVKNAIEVESEGALDPGAGSLYRIFGRLMTRGLVKEVETASDEPHPGLARKYYALSGLGERALAAESKRLRSATALAAERLGTLE